jgi:hypothetical protein
VPSDLPHRWSAGLAGTWRHYRPSAPRSTLARASQKPDYHACGRFGSLPEKGPAARESEAPVLQRGCHSSRCRVVAILHAAAPRSNVLQGRCSPVPTSPGLPAAHGGARKSMLLPASQRPLYTELLHQFGQRHTSRSYSSRSRFG